MEQNKFEQLEEVDQENTVVVPEKPALKEYEKLLLAESDRQLIEKAKTLVKIGCFEQKQEPVVDFANYTKIDMAKKYKGLYSLYIDNETSALTFICPLIEDNKGDDTAPKKVLAPYAYDMIVTDAMDDETYALVCKAAKNNLKSVVKTLYIAAYVTFFALIFYALYIDLYLIISAITAKASFWEICAQIFSTTATYSIGIAIALPLLVLASIKYKKYKDQ